MEPLHVFACYSNPLRWRARLENFRRFEHQILAVRAPLTTVECSYGEREWDLPERDGVLRVRVRAVDLMWHKENLLDLAAQQTPNWRYAACVDADLHFIDPSWPTETLHALQIHKLAQISSELILVGPQGQHLNRLTSIMKLYLDAVAEGHAPPPGSMYDPPFPPVHLKQHGYPGGAWAYRRESWDAIGGLLDKCIVGAADHHMAQGLLGLRQAGEPRGLSPAYDRYLDGWSTRAMGAIHRDVGLVPGLAVHYWHGKTADRKYQTRPQILKRNRYDPSADVFYDSQSVLRLSGNKPQLRDDLAAYFRGRNEDSIDL